MRTTTPRYAFFFKPRQDPLRLAYQQATTLHDKLIAHQRIH